MKSSIAAAAAVLLFVFNANANEPFHVKWTMDYTQAGVSDHANFAPSDAILAGGPNTFTLPTVYSTGGGAFIAGYTIRPWPAAFSASRYTEFTFAANSFKYNITSLSFRLRHSPNGPNNIKIRTSYDGFAADLNAFVITDNSVYKTYTVPVSYTNLSGNQFSVRIYAFNSVDIYGTLGLDEISVNGEVLAIVLPVDLNYFKGVPVYGNAENGQVALEWETSWEKNSKEFIVERSIDMKAFAPIGTVAASGETMGRTYYTFIDNDPSVGNNYYRLRLVGKDAGFATCKPIVVFNPEPFSGVQVAPNPLTSRMIALTAADSHEALLTLYNKSGVSVPFRRENGPGGRIFLTPSGPLPSGIYFVVYVKNGVKEHLKVLVP